MTALIPHPMQYSTVDLPWVHVRVLLDPVRGIWDHGTRVILQVGEKPPTLLTLFYQLDLDDEFYRETLHARINGARVDRCNWHLVRPKPNTFVTFAPPLEGKFGKIFGALAGIILLAGSLFFPGGWAGAPGIFGTLGKFSATKIGKFLIGLAAIGLNLALQGLAKPKDDTKWEKQLGFASVQNEFEPGAPFKLWMGTFKDSLQITIPTFTEIDGDDQFATIGFCALGFFSAPKFYAGDVELTTVQDREVVVWEVVPGRANHLLWSDDAENAVWVRSVGIDPFGSGSEANTDDILAPDGTQTANFVRFNNDAGTDTLSQDSGLDATFFMTYAKWFRHQLSGPQWVKLLLVDPVSLSNVSAYFDIWNGVLGSVVNEGTGTMASSEMRPGPDGWWLCILRGKPSTSGTQTRAVERPTTNGTTSNAYTGDGVHGYYSWRAQLQGGNGEFPLAKTTTEILVDMVPPSEVTAVLGDQTKVERSHNIKLSEWELEENDANDNDDAQLIDGTVEETEPIWHMVETLTDVDAFRIEYLWDSGLVHNKGGTAPNQNAGYVVLRHRMARRNEDGSWGDWVNLPQLTVRAKRGSKGVRVQFYIHWVDFYPAETGNGWPGSPSGVTDYQAVMGWGDAFVQSDWLSDFLTVSGDGFIEWWWENQEKVHLYLLKSEWPVGRYKFEVKRSWPAIWSTYNPNGYYSGGVVPDPLRAFAFFGEGGGYYVNDFFAPVTVPGESTLKVPVNPGKMQQSCSLSTVQNIWNEFPIVPKATRKTHVFIRVKNQEIGIVKALWTRLIPDWNGTYWIEDQPTNNPAALYLDVLKGRHNAIPVPDALIDEASLIDWYDFNVDTSNHCNMMLPQGGSVLDALRAVALCGFARPIYAPLHSVVIDRIRPLGPVGLISSRSASGFNYEMLLDEKPHGFEVSYADEHSDYEVKPVRVYAPGYNVDGSEGLTIASRIQTTTYPGITTEAKAIDRADRDLRWIYYRSMPLICTQALAYREHEPGDLVLVETEILGRKAGRGRIVEITRTGGADAFRDIVDVRDEMHPRFVDKGSALVSAIKIDETPYFGPAQASVRREPDYRDVLHVRQEPFPMGIELRERNGNVSVHQISSYDPVTREIALSTPTTLDIDVGDELITGKYGTASREMLVWDIVPRGRKQAQLMLLDYAEKPIYFPNMPEGQEFVTDFGNIVYDNNVPVWDAI